MQHLAGCRPPAPLVSLLFNRLVKPAFTFYLQQYFVTPPLAQRPNSPHPQMATDTGRE